MISLVWAVVSLGYTDNSDEASLEVRKGDIIKRSFNPQCVIFSGIAEVIPASFLAIVRSPSESRCRNA